MTYNQIMQSQIPLDALANEFIHDGNITLLYSSNQAIRNMWKKLQQIHIPTVQFDMVVWPSKNMVYSTTVVYKYITKTSENINFAWNKRIWSSLCKESDNFLLWKVMRNALKMKAKLFRFGMQIDGTCLHCGDELETNLHLYYKCTFLFPLWKRLLMKLGRNDTRRDSLIEWNIIYKTTRWKNKKKYFSFDCCEKYIRVVWKQKNDRLFNGKSKNENQIWNEIMQAIKDGLKFCSFPFDDSDLEMWC